MFVYGIKYSNYNNPARLIIKESYVMLNVQGPLLDLVFVVTSFSFVFQSIHPSILFSCA